MLQGRISPTETGSWPICEYFSAGFSIFAEISVVGTSYHKHKILNDPVYGFITIPGDHILWLTDHPWFQRLRYIKQLGLTHYVYPGANHSRFQHALGALHLTRQAVQTLREKGHDISSQEAEAVYTAILLHDIGHGPFSHALEKTIVNNIDHESLSLLFMQLLNEETGGRLDLAIEVFCNRYHRKFLHELVSSQLDMDRLDYLRRDSFFTGVIEGSVGSSRIIKMLNCVDNRLVLEEKGIYSIEKFLISRRFMYWQVYMHKTALSAEFLLLKILRRAKIIAGQGEELFATPSLRYFLYHEIRDQEAEHFDTDLARKLASAFARLTDDDIFSSVKVWSTHEDKVLSSLCSSLLSRNLYAVEIQNEPFDKQRLREIKTKTMELLNIEESLSRYFVFTETVANSTHKAGESEIRILRKDGSLSGISAASDMFQHDLIAAQGKKYVLFYPKTVRATLNR